MTNFTRPNVRALQSDLSAALAAVAQKHGINITMGNARFSESECRFSKIICQAKGTLAQAAPNLPVNSARDPYNTLESREYINLAHMHNLPTDGLGKTFVSMGRTFTIIGLKSSRRKYPVTAVGSQGGRYKFSATSVRNGMR